MPMNKSYESLEDGVRSLREPWKAEPKLSSMMYHSKVAQPGLQLKSALSGSQACNKVATYVKCFLYASVPWRKRIELGYVYVGLKISDLF